MTEDIQTNSIKSEFGYIDSDGNVWLDNNGAKPILVGIWKAGSLAEGLNFFQKKYQDLFEEINLLKIRLKNNPLEVKHIEANIEAIKDKIATPNFVGDLSLLKNSLGELTQQIASTIADNEIALKEEKNKAKEQKNHIISQAEKLSHQKNNWKKTGTLFDKLLAEWKQIKRTNKTDDDLLWEQFSKARRQFEVNRAEYFRELNKQKNAVKNKKNEIIDKAKLIVNSTDWNKTTKEFQQLLNEWKSVGRGNSKTDDKQWVEFKELQDQFFQAKKHSVEEKLAEYQINFENKIKLIEAKQAEILTLKDKKTAKRKYYALLKELDSLGKIPREKMTELDKKLANIEEKVLDDVEKKNSKVEESAIAAQLSSKINYYADLAKQAAAKGNKKAEKEALANLEKWQKLIN